MYKSDIDASCITRDVPCDTRRVTCKYERFFVTCGTFCKQGVFPLGVFGSRSDHVHTFYGNGNVTCVTV